MTIVRQFLSVLVRGGLALSALGLAGGMAQAAPGHHWCPGDQWDPSWGTAYDWDWGQCHDWQGAAGPAGFGPWGPPPVWAPPQPFPPPWAPGAHVMWKTTDNAWGFWNNGIWTPI